MCIHLFCRSLRILAPYRVSNVWAAGAARFCTALVFSNADIYLSVACFGVKQDNIHFYVVYCSSRIQATLKAVYPGILLSFSIPVLHS